MSRGRERNPNIQTTKILVYVYDEVENNNVYIQARADLDF